MSADVQTKYDIETLKEKIGRIVRVDKKDMLNDDFVAVMLEALEARSVLVFSCLGLTSQEQLAFTDKLGSRVNFTKTVSGADEEAADVYTVTLDREVNQEPEYVLSTFFWHLDGVAVDMPPPRASLLSCRRTAPKGGQMEFASTYAAYAALPDDEKQKLEGLTVLHSVTATVREVARPEELEPVKRGFKQEHPLIGPASPAASLSLSDTVPIMSWACQWRMGVRFWRDFSSGRPSRTSPIDTIGRKAICRLGQLRRAAPRTALCGGFLSHNAPNLNRRQREGDLMGFEVVLQYLREAGY